MAKDNDHQKVHIKQNQKTYLRSNSVIIKLKQREVCSH